MTKTTEPKPEFPYNKQSCSGNETAFSVEARFVAKGSRPFGKQIFTDDWQRIHFDKHPMGVPTISSPYEFAKPYFGLMNYQAAQALRWWFHAALEAEHLDTCFESRIVKHKIKYSMEEEAVSAHEVMGNSDNLDRDTQMTRCHRREKNFGIM